MVFFFSFYSNKFKDMLYFTYNICPHVHYAVVALIKVAMLDVSLQYYSITVFS